MDNKKIAKEIMRIVESLTAMSTYNFPDIPKFRFIIHSKDLSESEHVHVIPPKGKDKEAKIWLFPVKAEWNYGFSEVELNEVLEAVAKKRNWLARKFRQLRRQARNQNKKAEKQISLENSLDDFKEMLEQSLVPSEIMKSYDGFWYFRFDEVNGLEPLIELEELDGNFTLLFQILDNDFKKRGWMKRYHFRNNHELEGIEDEIHGYLDELE